MRCKALLAAIEAGEVAVLLVHEANPAYALPKDERICRPAAQGGLQGLNLDVSG